MFFSDSFFIQSFIVVIIILCLLNTAGYFIVLAALCYIGLLAITLLYSGYQVAAIFMLLAEIHVIYIIFCLALGWVRFDTITLHSVETSVTNYNLLIIVAIIVLALGWSTKFFIATVAPSTYLATFTLVTPANYMATSTGWTTSILTILANAYLNTQLFEFFILNIFMFLAAYVFYRLRNSIRTVMLENSCAGVNTSLESFKLLITPIREQSQTTQLDSDSTVRCVSLSNLDISSDATASLLN